MNKNGGTIIGSGEYRCGFRPNLTCKKTHKQKVTLNMNQSGGKVIGSGAYGCVFKPNLTCKKKTKQKITLKNGVSKLMRYKDSKYEYNVSSKVKKKLKHITNIEDYILFDKQLCKIGTMNKNDHTQLKQKCSDNINNLYQSNKADLRILQMEYGGDNLDVHVRNLIKQPSSEQVKEVIKINHSLQYLIKGGILPLHKKNIYHTDIKGLNMVLDENYKLRLIDWGLAKTVLPKTADFKGIHFNRPFESVLFNLNDNVHENTYIKQLIKFIDIFENDIFKSNASDIMKITKGSNTIFNVNRFMLQYLITIANQCSKKKRFDKKYFLKHFYKKQDYWGLCVIFLDIYFLLDLPNELKKKIEVLWIYLINNLVVDTIYIQQLLKNINIEN